MANTCVSCKRVINPPELRGTQFVCKGENGTNIAFWMCSPCAIPLGPGQGPIRVRSPDDKTRMP